MNDELLFCTVQPEDTLASIAERDDMAENELRYFHNENCRSAGLLWSSRLTAIQKIVVARSFKSAAEVASADQQALPPKELTTNFYAHQYTVAESFEINIEKEVKMAYDLALEARQNKEHDQHNWIASVRCFGFLRYGSRSDDKMSEIWISCAGSIAPMFFFLSEHGKMLGSYRFESLLKAFQQNQADLEDFFGDEV